jgi:hypothetical protein
MIAFLFTFGLVAFLVVAGTRGSLHLRTHRVFTGRRLSGLRRSYAVPMGYKTADSREAEEMTRYTRKAAVISILIIVTLSVIIIGALSTFIH